MHQPFELFLQMHKPKVVIPKHVHKCLYTKRNIALTKFKQKTSHFSCIIVLFLVKFGAQDTQYQMY